LMDLSAVKKGKAVHDIVPRATMSRPLVSDITPIVDPDFLRTVLTAEPAAHKRERADSKRSYFERTLRNSASCSTDHKSVTDLKTLADPNALQARSTAASRPATSSRLDALA